jgi:hypothetical protein
LGGSIDRITELNVGHDPASAKNTAFD